MAKLNSSHTIHNLNYKDLKRECISRGMDFQEVVTGDFPKLNQWLNINIKIPKDLSLINKYDDWIDEILISRGKSNLVHNSLRLSYIGERVDNDEAKPKKIKEAKPKKPKREKTSTGIYKGTKKAMVWKMVERGRDLETTIKRVLKYFPDAKEKSIKIWYNKRKREIQ